MTDPSDPSADLQLTDRTGDGIFARAEVPDAIDRLVALALTERAEDGLGDDFARLMERKVCAIRSAEGEAWESRLIVTTIAALGVLATSMAFPILASVLAALATYRSSTTLVLVGVMLSMMGWHAQRRGHAVHP